jgi:hypothetical protein
VDQEACSVLAATGREEGVQAWTDGTAAGGEVAQQICAPAGLPSADWQGPVIPRFDMVDRGPPRWLRHVVAKDGFLVPYNHQHDTVSEVSTYNL